MTTRTLILLTSLVILGMVILFAINLKNILSGHFEPETYLKYNHVRGMAVEHNHLLYTLNFAQQNQMIDLLNQSVPIFEIKSGKQEKPQIEKLVIYPFNQQPDLIITPISYDENHNLVFSIPQWNKNGYLMDLSEGDLQKLLSQTYDP